MLKAIAVALLLLVGFHLLLYGYLRRRIAVAKRLKEAENDR